MPRCFVFLFPSLSFFSLFTLLSFQTLLKKWLSRATEEKEREREICMTNELLKWLHSFVNGFVCDWERERERVQQGQSDQIVRLPNSIFFFCQRKVFCIISNKLSKNIQKHFTFRPTAKILPRLITLTAKSHFVFDGSSVSDGYIIFSIFGHLELGNFIKSIKYLPK